LFLFIQKRIPEAGDGISILVLGVSITATISLMLTSEPLDLVHRPSHILSRHRGMPIQPIFGNRICVTISLFLQILAVPFFPLIAAAMGWFHRFEEYAISSGRGLDPGQPVDPFTPALPIYTNTALSLAAIKIHQSIPYACFSKNSLPTPQLGQNQESGRSSKAVPGAMPPAESPSAGS
jgi:hypothetical protein